jgi:tetratricopeptide (TPR) repeat protein
LLERAAKARVKSNEADQERLSDAQYALGMLFITQMNPGPAERWLRAALGTRQALLGAKHEKTAQCLAALGAVLEPVPEEAEKLFRQALPLYRTLYGEEHPQTALVLSGLARALYRQNQTAEALPLAEKAHAIYLDNPEEALMVQNLSTLAMLYKRHKRLAEAEGLQRQLVALLEKTYGPRHQGFGVELGNLAGILVEKGEEKEATALFYRALFIKEEGSPPNPSSIAHTLTSLAGLHAKKGEFGKAEPLAKRAYLLRAETFGEEHPQTRESFSLLRKIRADKS